MSPNSPINVTLLIQARCNATGQLYDRPTQVTILSDQKEYIAPASQVFLDCPTGDGSATTVGQLFYIENGIVTNTVLLEKFWHIHFTSCLVNEQEIGSDTEYMSSVVYFQAQPANQRGEHLLSLSCSIRQPYSEDLSFADVPLEVFRPVALHNVDPEDFRKNVEAYYRHLVGPTGVGFRIDKVVRDIQLQNIEVRMPGGALVKILEPSTN